MCFAGALITSSPDFEYQQKGNTACLVIRETYAEDAGRFTCTVSNKSGSASYTFMLQVHIYIMSVDFCVIAYSFKTTSFIQMNSSKQVPPLKGGL